MLRNDTKTILQSVAALLTAVPLIVAGADGLLAGNLVTGWVFTGAGVSNLILLVWKIKRRAPQLILLDALNTIVLGYVAFDYFVQGKKYLPYAYIIAATVSIVVSIFMLRKRPALQNTVESTTP